MFIMLCISDVKPINNGNKNAGGIKHPIIYNEGHSQLFSYEIVCLIEYIQNKMTNMHMTDRQIVSNHDFIIDARMYWDT